MALDEYQKVTYVQEKASVEFEIQSARTELECAKEAIPEAKERLARIESLMKDRSDFNRYMEDEYSGRVATVPFTEKKGVYSKETGRIQ